MEETTQYTLLKIINDGGWTMIPLAICSLIALTVVLERFFWGPRLSRTMPEDLQKEVSNLIEEGKFDEVLGLCRANTSPLARIIVSALRHAKKSRQELVEAVELTGREEAQRLQKGLPILSTIAAISPLLGLLGTVFGMIQTFAVISQHGVGNANLLSAGISAALISTATGLTIALPVVVFYRYFIYQTQKITLAMEGYALALLEKVKTEHNELRKTGT